MTRGYASFDYHLDSYQEGDLVKLTILVNQEPWMRWPSSSTAVRPRPAAAA